MPVCVIQSVGSMTKIRLAIQMGALAALGTSTALMGQNAPQDLLSKAEPEAAAEAPATAAQPASVQEAFEGTVFAEPTEIVQKTYPLTGEWNVAQAEELVTFIEGIGAEGLDPADYGIESLRTAISAILFATLSGMAPAFSPRFIELALMMTILVGLFQLLAGLVRLGGLVSFVSHSVITAFTAAAALLIGVSQLAGAAGVKVEPGGNVIERLHGL